MKALGKLTKTEAVLLVLTLVFLVCTGVLFGLRSIDRTRGEYVVRTEGVQTEAAAPSSAEEEAPAGPPEPTAEHPLNINTAEEAELDMLPGIGPVLAQRIVEYRQANGPFAATEEIMQVDGIGESTYEELQDLITVGEA